MFTRSRRKDLAISFGIVLLLVFSVGLVLLASRRAQDLAKLKVDFVTGVSHDLRTPIAIMSLAADNLADGVVYGREAVVQYGTRLQVQVRHLAERVEQILLFASLDRDKATYRASRVEVSAIVERALQNLSALIDETATVLDVCIDSDLPPLFTDAGALTQVLQNLITNAVKYGGEDRWVGIRACIARTGRSGSEAQLAVEDHGIGIEPAELDQVFEPFYRCTTAIERHIRGTGLGLTVAKRTIEALGGSISVSSTFGTGSRFVIHLPAAERSSSEIPAETGALSREAL
jgi:two-component system phosphate regulon sensor histidine kinase PhoR